MKITVILNSTIKKKKSVYEKLMLLESSHVAAKLTVLETDYCGHGIELAKNAAADSDCMVAAGGDGTLHEVVNGIMQSGLSKEKRPMLAIFPCGSANDYVKTVNISDDIHVLIDLVRKQHVHPIDLGWVQYLDAEGNPKERYFANMLDLGLGAEVVNRLNSSKKILGVNFTFFKSITGAFLTYQKSKITCKINREEFTEKVLSQIFAIGKYFGNGIYIAPDAKPDNGFFQSVTVGDISTFDYIQNIRKLKQNKRINHSKLNYRKCTFAEVNPVEYSIAAEADGEFIGYAPLKAEIKMHELKLLCDQFPKE